MARSRRKGWVQYHDWSRSRRNTIEQPREGSFVLEHSSHANIVDITPLAGREPHKILFRGHEDCSFFVSHVAQICQLGWGMAIMVREAFRGEDIGSRLPQRPEKFFRTAD